MAVSVARSGTRRLCSYMPTALGLRFSFFCQLGLGKIAAAAVGCHFEPQRGWRQVEYGIRTTIIAAWNHRDEDIWVYYIPENVRDAQRPSNGEFISQIACILELWRKCNKEAGHGSE